MMKNKSLLLISLLSVIVVMLMPPIPQELAYHEFADQKVLFGIPNFLNVMSNVPFLIVGFLGFRLIAADRQINLVKPVKTVYQLFFLSVLLVGSGSSIYHLSPSNYTLLWDRLPMAVAFMSFFTIVVAEFINEKLAARLFLPLLLAAIASVLYWYWSESMGQGDLRFYLLIQFLPMVLMPVILTLYSPSFSRAFIFWLVFACYGLAKGLEMSDAILLEFTGVVSGHTLKHLVSAVAPFLLYMSLKRRSPVKAGVS